MTDDLTTWLRARLDEDEQRCQRELAGQAHDGPCINYHDQDPADYADGEGCIRHFERYLRYMDNRFGLADVAAKRAILDEIAGWRHDAVQDGYYSCAKATEANGFPVDQACCDDDRIDGPCDCGLDWRRDRLVRLLAAPYAYMPGYRDEWRPQ